VNLSFERKSIVVGKTNFCLLILILTPIWLAAQTLRPSAWQGEYIDYLHHRGYLWDLSPLEQPYSASELERETSNVKREETGSRDRMPDTGYRTADTRYVGMLNELISRMTTENEAVLGWLQSGNDYRNTESKGFYHARQRGAVGMRVTSWLEVYDTFYLDNRLDEDPTYLGKQQNGMASYSEQAYAQARYKNFTFKFGRDFLRWGPGRDATLMISDYSRPMDQVYASYKSRYFSFSSFTASLDAYRISDTGYQMADAGYQIADTGGGIRANRYLSGHRLEVRPWKYLYIGISEAILFGGPDFGYNLAYTNPFIFYHGVQANGPDGGNTIGSVSLAFMPKRNYYFYGEYMIDDIQLENEFPGDLEPNEIGYLAGLNIANPFRLTGLDIYGEYTRITNRTFNTLQPWEKWLHRNQPIGHFLGNDFDRLLVGGQYWPEPAYRVGLQYEKRSRGEGRIEKSFDTPWMNTPPGETYSEPFPTGIVESSDIFQLSFTWQPKWWIRIGGEMQRWNVENKENVVGVDVSFTEWTITVEFDVLDSWHIGE
jgi:hypothetical protein